MRNGDDSQSVSDAESVKSAGDLIDLSDNADSILQFPTIYPNVELTGSAPTACQVSSQPNNNVHYHAIKPANNTSLQPTADPFAVPNWTYLNGQSCSHNKQHYNPFQTISSEQQGSDSSKMDKWEKFE